MNRNLIKNYICIMYPVFSLVYFFYLFFSGIRTGIVMTFFLLLGIAGICILGLIDLKATEDKIFSLYVVYNLLSGIWCIAFGMPPGVFIGEVSTTVLPMMLYYAGRGFDDEYAGRYYHGYILAALFMGTVGAVLYIWAPQFYIDFSYDNMFISLADVPTMRVRMESLTGSTVMACLAAYSMCASSFFLRKDDRRSRNIGLVYIILSIVYAFMANQRSAMFCIILMLLFFNLIDFLVDKRRPLKYLWMEIAAVAALLLGFFVFVRGIIDKFWARLSSIPAGFGERSESWIAAVNNVENFWIGDGLGSRGHRAAPYEEYIVADGGLVKLYAEMGLIGTSFIIFVLALVYIKAFRKQPPTSERKGAVRKLSLVVPELAIVTSAILMSIGSNVLEMEICVPIVYFALGRAVRKLNEDIPGEEYVGAFEDKEQEEREPDMEGAPAAHGDGL